jgi:alcohol dehydrogenase class IV
VGAIESLVATLQISKLSAFGLGVDELPEIVAQAQRASSMKANPVVLTPVELAGILSRAR